MFIIDDNNIFLTRGDTAEFGLDVVNEETGEPFDYSECLTEFTVKQSAFTEDIVIQKTFTDGIVKINPEDTEGLPYQTLKFDVQIITPENDVYTVMSDCDFTLMKEENFRVTRT